MASPSRLLGGMDAISTQTVNGADGPCDIAGAIFRHWRQPRGVSAAALCAFMSGTSACDLIAPTPLHGGYGRRASRKECPPPLAAAWTRRQAGGSTRTRLPRPRGVRAMRLRRTYFAARGWVSPRSRAHEFGRPIRGSRKASMRVATYRQSRLSRRASRAVDGKRN